MVAQFLFALEAWRLFLEIQRNEVQHHHMIASISFEDCLEHAQKKIIQSCELKMQSDCLQEKIKEQKNIIQEKEREYEKLKDDFLEKQKKEKEEFLKKQTEEKDAFEHELETIAQEEKKSFTTMMISLHS